MLCTHEARGFVPYGRLYSAIHPGSVPDDLRCHSDHPEALQSMFREFSINDKKESWKLRRSHMSEGSDEELYVSDRVVIWSQGTSRERSQVLRCFTTDTPVIEALWCNFLIPVNFDIPVHNIQSPIDPIAIAAQIQSSVCIVEAGCVNVFMQDGCNYAVALPFPVKKTWEIKDGLLFERKVLPVKKEITKTPKKEDVMSTKLPILFSLTHPLEELAPVICKTGHSPATTKISFVTDTTLKIVHTSPELSLAMTFDSSFQSHSLWLLRRAKPEEADTACGFSAMESRMSSMVSANETSHAATPTAANHSTVLGSSRLSMHSAHSPFSDSQSPFRSCNSRVSSPSVSGLNLSTGGLSRVLSPNFNRLAVFSRSHSPQRPNSSLYRLHTPSPQTKLASASFKSSTVGGTSLPADQFSSTVDFAEPLMPEICLEHVWSEAANNQRDGSVCAASKAFCVADLSGQQYICYLLKYKQQLRCIRFEESNDKTHLVFGSIATIAALDAVPLMTLQMILTIDTRYSLILYSGTTKMHVVHIPGLPNPVMLPPPPQPTECFADQSFRPEPMTSSRPTSALDFRLDDELRLLSPVVPEWSSRPNLRLIDSPIVDESNVPSRPFANLGCVLSLSDSVDNRFTLELTDNSLYRAAFPETTCSPVIYSCLQALRWILPRDSALILLTKWYCLHNAPGIGNSKSEWNQFLMCLLGLLGYDTNSHPLIKMMDSPNSGSLSPTLQLKKPRLSSEGTDADWTYLLNSDHHNLFCQSNAFSSGLDDINEGFDWLSVVKSNVTKPVDASAPLFSFMNYVLFALHLVYEDLRLDIVLQNQLTEIATLLYCLAKDLGHELYTDHYCRDVPKLFLLKNNLKTVFTPDALSKVQMPSVFTAVPPNIYQWLYNLLQGQDCTPYPYIQGVNIRSEHLATMYGMMFKSDKTGKISREKFLLHVSSFGRHISTAEPNALRTPLARNTAERVVLYMTDMDENLRSRLALGAVIPLKEAISYCQMNPPSNWPEAAYNLIGREDLAKQMRHDIDEKLAVTNPLKKEFCSQSKSSKEEDDGISCLDYELLKLRFSKDLRIKEVRKLLQSSLPVCINITQKPEISDHEFIEEQERYLFATSIRTMALPVGRGMLTLRTYNPIPTEALPIPKLCLTGRAPPRNTTIEMTHIDVPTNMSHWPQFHNGVAAGLRISNNLQLESTWILLNKARSESLTNEHAGFLMGQGLNGHLSSLPTLSVHDYLVKGHEMTSMGLLLGISANKRGTMDIGLTKLLSIHIAALLPPTSTELDVPHNVQVAAILGVGLVYQGTAQRHIAEVLLAEIGRPPGPEMENSVDRESYSLAAGLALGLVMLGKGSEVLGLSDMGMPDQLYHYMVGGQKRPLTASYRDRYKSPSYQIKEGDCVNVDVTGPGATLALGMMFFDTNNSSVAEWFVAPDTQSLLDLVRPDFLMLRTLSRSLIMWQSIEPTHAWIHNNLPQIVDQYAFEKRSHTNNPDCDIDFETMSQAYCNIVGGGCMAIALKYAGSCHLNAFNTLYDMAIKILRLMPMPGLVEQAGKTTVENCLSVIIICLAMVMAGSGDLAVLRLCRVLRARIGSPVTYGSHMAVSMACGLLFIGGGKYTLNTRPESVAAMLCAFYPRFPNHSNDNRFHLQAFRHLYVLAVERRLIIPRDVSTNKACYVELEIIYRDGRSVDVVAPYMLPELELLSEVRVKGPRYWEVKFKVDSNWDALKKLLSGHGYLFVKQRAGYLSLEKDPKGYQSLLAQSLSREETFGKILKANEIKSFTSDPFVLGFAEFFCTAASNKESQLLQMLSQVLHECVSHEKLEILSTLTSLHQNVSNLSRVCRPINLWQLKLIAGFYENAEHTFPQACLVTPEFTIASQSKVEAILSSWLQKSGPALASYFGGPELLPESLDKHTCKLLAAFLTWYSIPHPRALRQMGLEKVQTFPALFNVLRPSGLSVSSIMSLTVALQSATDVRHASI